MRKSNYLHSPKVSKPHISINSKEQLSDNLVNFSELSQANIESYVKSACKGESPNISKVYVITAEEAEAQRIENLTNKEIALRTFDIISELSIENKKLYEERFNKNIKKKKKEDYVTFYYEI